MSAWYVVAVVIFPKLDMLSNLCTECESFVAC